jgi:hypothetical protein
MSSEEAVVPSPSFTSISAPLSMGSHSCIPLITCTVAVSSPKIQKRKFFLLSGTAEKLMTTLGGTVQVWIADR